MVRIARTKKRWTARPGQSNLFPAYWWPIGHRATMRDCYGKHPVAGEVIAHTAYSVLIMTRNGERIWGGTSLLEDPTGEIWPWPRNEKVDSSAGSGRRSRKRSRGAGGSKSMGVRSK